jgi:hypothetical protein
MSLVSSLHVSRAMPTRLTIADPNLFPVQAFFNAVSDSSFVRMTDLLTSEIGYTSDEAHCRFPSDLDPGEETFSGVSFQLFEDRVIINQEQLRTFLIEACSVYLETHSSDRAVLERYLERDIPM